MTTPTLDLRIVDAPEDSPPDTAPPVEPTGGTPFDPQYPDSTPEAPFGFKPDGTPYKRHHGGRSGGPTVSRSGGSKTNEALAVGAAKMLCQVNSLVGMSMAVFGMPQTAADIEAANKQFETMATESLKTDPALCRKILSAGATSGRTGLMVAYIYLAGSAFPSAREEIKANREAKAAKEVEEGYVS